MSFSQSIGEALTPTVCQFCDESTEIKWKCINCELFLCQMCCSKIHTKSKSSMKHEIINLKDFGKQDCATLERKVNLRNMVCTIHRKQKCFVFCKDCSQPACSKCLTETHKMHDYEALDERYGVIISEMKELIIKFDSNLQFYKNEKYKLQKIFSNGDNNYKQTRDSILQTEKEMIEAISKHAKELLKKLEAKWKPSENMIKTELSAITKREEELETRKKNLNQALQSHQVEDIFSTSKTLDKSLQKYPAKTICPIRTKFIPRYISVKKENYLVPGDIYTVPKMELLYTYQSNSESVTNIIFCSDNNAFIGSFDKHDKPKLQKVKFENRKTNVEIEILIMTYDIAMTQDGEILVSSGGSDLRLYNKNGRLKTFKSFSPLKTLSVHITKDNKIIVGLTESFPVKLPLTKDIIQRLVVLNQNRDIKHTIEYDRGNQRIITCPHRINSINDKILVVDIINRYEEGRVVMLDYLGELHWTYNGCDNINTDQVKFYPKDVAIISTDMIILVSDCYNHAIHVLNHGGELIDYKDVKSLGIELPVSLQYDQNEVLWIGCTTPTKFKFSKATIHCITLT